MVNATMYESYASVVQTRTIKILNTIAANEGLNFITGDIGNAKHKKRYTPKQDRSLDLDQDV